jgi:PEP-CTERM motif
MKKTLYTTVLRGKNVALTTLALVAMVTSASAASITNGSFESTTETGTPFSAGLGSSNRGTTTVNLTGWTSTGYNFVYVPGDGSANGSDGPVQLYGPNPNSTASLFPASPDGGNYVALDSDFEQGPLSTTVTGLTFGQTVSVSFYWAGGQQNQSHGVSTDDLEVTLGGQEITTNTITDASKGDTPWVLDTLTFTVTSHTGSETLSFLADGHPDGEPSFVLLDGVSVSVPPSATPEPSSLILLGTGLAGIAGVLRRKLGR